ncbi:IS1595 family transposase [Roseomonas sp. NAR14]|uniref:IS1595 family transposase n=2 Tax=Roseomonas acroporae TaxID=2937791 RepID=A0A9X1YB85_9PROT|nr:IS1595 family transposase [Roseomonas acroporae]
MQTRNHQHPLSGLVQVDDAYLGGEATLGAGDKTGHGAPNKRSFVVAVATRDGRPTALHLRRVEAFSKAAIRPYADQHLAPGSRVVSDGLACFTAFAEAGFEHTPIRTGSSKRPTTPQLAWANTILGNVKAAITGTCRALRPRHADRYLAGFEYRFNRRTNLPSMIHRLATAALSQPPTPYRHFVPADKAG